MSPYWEHDKDPLPGAVLEVFVSIGMDKYVMTLDLFVLSVLLTRTFLPQGLSTLSFYFEPELYWEAPESQLHIWASKNWPIFHLIN